MITLDTLEKWLIEPAEHEQLEFKEAKQQFDTTKLMKYCAAIANEGGGHMILGVSNKIPRQIVGTHAFDSITSLNSIKTQLHDKLGFRVNAYEIQHPQGRVLTFAIPSRPFGQPVELDGQYWMRSGESLKAMTPDVLKRIFAEDSQKWFSQPAYTKASSDDVISLLDTQAYFDLIKYPYPANQNGVLERLESEGFIVRESSGWIIQNLGAILLAKQLDMFSPTLARKAPRFIEYEGANKLKTRNELQSNKGYASGFERLVDFIHAAAPKNRFVEEVIREEIKMFPRQAIRELVANALIHQDFQASGASVMIEMYEDRLEISNPGIPPIPVDRFIDEYQSRNERIADLMRRMHICEEKGSGIDKTISAVESLQLPAPDFRAGNLRTTIVLFGPQDFSDMRKPDRIRACYQHCCLQYVSNNKMTNESLRSRFGLSNSAASSSIASQIISATREEGLIKPDDRDSKSSRYIRYIPGWA